MRDFFFYRLTMIVDFFKFNGFADAVASTFHLANCQLRREHWGKVGRYRMFGMTFRFDAVDSLETLLCEHFASSINYFLADRPDPVIVDVGANIGDTVLYFKHRYPKARIYAFEPLQRAFALLKENVEANGLKDVHIFHEALLDRDGTIDLHVMPGHFLGSSMHKEWTKKHLMRPEQGAVVERVPVKSFDERIASLGVDRIDFLKIDIEGAEAALLRGCGTALDKVDRVSIEYHLTDDLAENSFDEIMAVLKKAGFEVCIFNGYRQSINWLDSHSCMILGRKQAPAGERGS